MLNSMKRRIFVGLALYVFCLEVLAGQIVADQELISVATGFSGNHVYVTTTDPVLVEGCREDDSRYVLPDDHPKFDVILSMLLSSLHAGAKVDIYVDGCGPSNYMKLQSLEVMSN